MRRILIIKVFPFQDLYFCVSLPKFIVRIHTFKSGHDSLLKKKKKGFLGMEDEFCSWQESCHH